jgi:polyisoprenoid-binding protein YceI
VDHDPVGEVVVSAGDLEVKGTTRPATFTGTAVVEDDELHLDATATVKLSDFDAGPISIYYATRTLLPAKTRVFVFVVEAFRATD